MRRSEMPREAAEEQRVGEPVGHRVEERAPLGRQARCLGDRSVERVGYAREDQQQEPEAKVSGADGDGCSACHRDADDRDDIGGDTGVAQTLTDRGQAPLDRRPPVAVEHSSKGTSASRGRRRMPGRALPALGIRRMGTLPGVTDRYADLDPGAVTAALRSFPGAFEPRSTADPTEDRDEVAALPRTRWPTRSATCSRPAEALGSLGEPCTACSSSIRRQRARAAARRRFRAHPGRRRRRPLGVARPSRRCRRVGSPTRWRARLGRAPAPATTTRRHGGDRARPRAPGSPRRRREPLGRRDGDARPASSSTPTDDNEG